MKCSGRRVLRVISPAISLVLLVLTAPAPLPAGAPALPAGEQPAAAKNETRLRKLHLVRPDLIPYPIAYEVYC
jgi:hypothetical protein